MRPTRSERRPAGPTASAPATRNTAGPSPRMLETPVTATIVTVPSATASWIIPDWKTSPAASRKALRRIVVTRRLQHGATARTRRRRRATGGGRTAPPSAACATRPTATTRRPRASSSAKRRPAATSARVGGRFDVAVPGWVGTTFQSSTWSARPSSASTRCTIVAVASAGPRPGQLPLGGERDPRDARAAVAGRLADQEERRLGRAPRDRRPGARAGVRRRRRPGRSWWSARSGQP